MHENLIYKLKTVKGLSQFFGDSQKDVKSGLMIMLIFQNKKKKFGN